MKAFKQYPIALAANGSQTILAEGSFVRVLAMTGAIAITLDDIGPFGPLNVGQGFNLPEPPGFKRVTVTDLTGSANTGTLLVADSTFVDQTLSGTVSVVDGEKARTLAGGMLAGSIQSNAVAAQFSVSSLFNPAASGKNLIITSAALTAPAQAGVYFVAGAAALGVDVSTTTIANKRIGAAVGSAQARTASAAAIPAFANSFLWALNVAAFGYVAWPIKGAIVIPPGKSLDCWGTNVNTQIQVNLEWFEENVT